MTQALAQRPKSGGSKPPTPPRPKSGKPSRPSSAAAAKPKVVKPDLIEALKTGGLQQYGVCRPTASARSAASRMPCVGDRRDPPTVSHVPCATTHHLCTAHPPSSAVCAWQRKLEEMGLVGVAQIVKMRRAQVDELIELLRPLPGHRLRLLNLFEEQRAYATPHTRTPG